MSIENLFGFGFIIFLTLLLLHYRKLMQVNGLFPLLYFVMYRTKLGLNAMDYLGKKWRKFFQAISTPIIITGFLGMALIVFELCRGLYVLITQPVAPAGVGIIQPFVPGVPGTVFVPFFYFIISVFIIATIHEFSHGVLARVWNIPVKSSGFAFLGIGLPVIPAAFVEPEEKIVRKRPAKQQLSIFAAGPVSNIVLGILVILFMNAAIAPMAEAMFEADGVEVVSYINGNVTYPAEANGLEIGEIIQEINGVSITDYNNFNETLSGYQPGDVINVTTNTATHSIPLAKRADRENGFLGVNVKPHLINKPEYVAQHGSLIPNFTRWFTGLLYWLFILNIGIGLFNLVPIGPIDGGRMLHTALVAMNVKDAEKSWAKISTFIFLILLGNIILAILK